MASTEFTGHKPSIHDVQIAAAGFIDKGEPLKGRSRLWQTPDGDDVGLFFVPLPPDLPRSNAVFKSYAHYLQGFLAGSKGRVIGCEVTAVGGCPSLISLYSVPQTPFGRTYVGSIMMPFAACNYVFRCCCEGRGAGGLKEAILLGRGIALAEYEDDQYDQEFPGHPVARARGIIRHLVSSTRISPATLLLPRFALDLEAG